MQTIFDFGTVGTIPVLMTPLVLYALTYALHLPVSKWRSAWPLSALTAGLLLLMSPLVVSRARRPPAGDSRVVRMCQKISHDPKAGLRLADGDWFGISAASLGDLDGDGVTEVAVGATGKGESYIKYKQGAVHVLFMNPDGTLKRSRMIASDYRGGPTLTSGSRFGTSVGP